MEMKCGITDSVTLELDMAGSVTLEIDSLHCF